MHIIHTFTNEFTLDICNDFILEGWAKLRELSPYRVCAAGRQTDKDSEDEYNFNTKFNKPTQAR